MSDLTNNQLLEQIIRNREEIKSTIEASETRLLFKFEELKKTIRELETENSELKAEIEKLKISEKRNHIIIFGLETESKEINTKYISKELKTLLDIDLDDSHFNDIYPLGKKKDRSVKIEFVSNLTKKNVFKNISKLKGTKIVITNDLTPKQRQEQKILRKHLLLARQDKRHSYIKHNKLYVEEIAYGVDDLLAFENQEERAQPTSAPTTPTVTNKGTKPKTSTEENAQAVRSEQEEKKKWNKT